MKKLINLPGEVVHDMMSGIACTRPEITYFPDYEVIARNGRFNKVGLVSGGGSGHEPAHSGYVGRGMLDAAVAGNVFASPSPDRILCAIEQVDNDMGVLLIIKNYSGDIMNFEIAAELASGDGRKVEKVIVMDDVAIDISSDPDSTGRRGIAGTVFVHKIAGAIAEQGADIAEVKRLAQKTADNVRTMGLSLSGATIPEVGKSGFTVGEDEVEIGMGIHGEPGLMTLSMRSGSDLAELLCGRILRDLDYSGRQTAVMVNGMGGTPLMELYIVANEVDKLLKLRGVVPVRYFVGNFMTSLEMSGCSISLLRLDDELLSLLDEPCDAPSFRR